MRARWLAVLALTSVTVAHAGRKKKPPVVEEAPPPPPPKTFGPVFEHAPPVQVGKLPPSLANGTSQACAACHSDQVSTWQASGHAHAAFNTQWRESARIADNPACTGCHLPLMIQLPELYDPENPSAGTTPNPNWDAGLAAEGITCIACHLRDGRMLSDQTTDGGPHRVGHAPDLADGTACAACHQLTWPGRETPFYDTYGEWKKTGWAGAKVGCVDCHDPHNPTLPVDRGLSALVNLDRPLIKRGSGPLVADLVLQNTGAGHHIPTGSPFLGLRLEARLVPRDGADGRPSEAWTTDLAMDIAPEPPWETLEDTRLASGEERAYEFELKLPKGASTGWWNLRLRLLGLHAGEPTGEVRWERNIPVEVR